MSAYEHLHRIQQAEGALSGSKGSHLQQLHGHMVPRMYDERSSARQPVEVANFVLRVAVQAKGGSAKPACALRSFAGLFVWAQRQEERHTCI
jgi:hypothetical protein